MRAVLEVPEGGHIPEDIASAASGGRVKLARAVAAHGGTPLRSDGRVTVLHFGVADRVQVRHWLDVAPPIPDLVRIEATDLWAASFDLDANARIEYKLSIHRHGRHRLLADPLNHHHAPNPWGFNSELRGADYADPLWALTDRTVPRGIVTVLPVQSDVFEAERTAHLYVPAQGLPTTLLVVHDGTDYRQFASLATVLDNLIAAGTLPPLAAVLTDPYDRLGEYRASTAHATHLVDEVIPAVRAELDIERVVAMGASLGAVASLHAAHSNPDVFDALILQAGSFVDRLGGPFRRGPVFAPVVRFMERLRAEPQPLPKCVHISCGRFDGLINENLRMAEEMNARGVDVGYADIAAGHDWRSWRDLLRDALHHTVGDGG